MSAAFVLQPGPRRGRVVAPPSKSHEHRLLLADFLAGDCSRLVPNAGDSADVVATKRCLLALGGDDPAPVLDCGESGSTLRFLAPVAAALGKRPVYKTAGRLASRPFLAYDSLSSGVHELPGNVSSQFVTGLLFALPLLDGDSEIVFTSPLESRGYVDLTCAVLAGAGVVVESTSAGGFRVKGGQRYRPRPDRAVEGDWSGATFWLAMNRLTSCVQVDGLQEDSAQPDRRAASILSAFPAEIDVSQCPDAFPALSVVAAAQDRVTRFVGVRRLRLKECDRLAAMADVLAAFGVATREEDGVFTVSGRGRLAAPSGVVPTRHDHRIAMAIAVAATCAETPAALDDAACAAKSYPGFFDLFARLRA